MVGGAMGGAAGKGTPPHAAPAGVSRPPPRRRPGTTPPTASGGRVAYGGSGRAGERAETAVGTGDDVLATDQLRVADQPLSDQLGMLAVVSGGVQHARNQDFAVWHLDVFEDRPLVLVPRIGRLKRQAHRPRR